MLQLLFSFGGYLRSYQRYPLFAFCFVSSRNQEPLNVYMEVMKTKSKLQADVFSLAI